MESIRQCKRCRKDKPIDEFYRKVDAKTGKEYRDRTCSACLWQRHLARKAEAELNEPISPEHQLILDRIVNGWRRVEA
jgi:hypothetical protein